MRLSTPLFVIVFLSLVCSAAVMAREAEPPPPMRFTQPETPAPPSTGAREDTLFLFAASGPGSYGSPGTDARGFTFDHAGGPAEAGWFGVDLTEQEGSWWHLAGTSICAGSGTDMSQALPFDTGDTVNDYALWCGREDVCSWANPRGYGSNWRQYAVVDLTAHPVASDLTIEFAYRSDFEGDNYDWFELRVDSAGVWKTVHVDQTTADRTFRELSYTVPAADFGGGATRVGFYFRSDGGWSDEDGSYDSDVGAVWIDNIVATVDGAQVFAEDFESGIEPPEIGYETPEGAGSYATLRRGVFQDDHCIYNPSYFWTFFDPGTTSPEYPTPLIPYGPPYVENMIQSPILELDQYGAPLDIGPETLLYIDWDYYLDSINMNALIFATRPEVAVWDATEQCLGVWASSNTTGWEQDGWTFASTDRTLQMTESAAGGPIDGIAIRLGVMDMCDVWCNIYGDGTDHRSGPFFDNIRVKLVQPSDIDWWVDPFRRLQDNFAELGGKVRIDSALDLQPYGSPTLVVGDSTTIDLNMDLLGGIRPDNTSVPGETRPSLYLHFRVVDGPHAESTDPAMGDPDASDGIWSPHIGTTLVNGETWNVAIADSAHRGGPWTVDRWAFDLADDYFEPGDIIEFYYRTEALSGATSARPNWAESADPYLRNYLHMRCLPTAGATVLFVEDDLGVLPWWKEAFAASGLAGYDIYSTQAPSSGLSNGLGCRAELGQLASYEMIVWDSGNLPSYTLANTQWDDLCFDTVLLEDWLNNTPHDTGLWVMGNEVATDQADDPSFLNSVLGAERIAYGYYYDDVTGITVPRVLATHPDLAYLDGTPHFRVDGGCPYVDNFDLVAPLGPLTEITHEWEVDPGYGAVAGILNRDPDGDGTALSPLGHANRTLFNPFGYAHVLDEGYGIPAGRDYARYMVRHVLMELFGQYLYDVAADLAPEVTAFHGVYPNPFNPSTTIRFSLAEPGPATLRVYDLTGRRLRTLLDGPQEAGTREIHWQGRDDRGRRLPSGVYFIRLETGDFRVSHKVVMVQ